MLARPCAAMGMHQLALTRNSHTPGTQDVEASVDGVLGGFGTVTDVDIKESDEFLSHLQAHKLLTVEPSSRAADCGAGIILMWKETVETCLLYTSPSPRDA